MQKKEIHLKVQGRRSGQDLDDRRSSQFTEKQGLTVTVIITGVGVKNDTHTNSGREQVMLNSPHLSYRQKSSANGNETQCQLQCL